MLLAEWMWSDSLVWISGLLAGIPIGMAFCGYLQEKIEREKANEEKLKGQGSLKNVGSR